MQNMLDLPNSCIMMKSLLPVIVSCEVNIVGFHKHGQSLLIVNFTHCKSISLLPNPSGPLTKKKMVQKLI